jgi:hypothetical protein
MEGFSVSAHIVDFKEAKKRRGNTGPLRDLERKMEADRRMINSAITICQC